MHVTVKDPDDTLGVPAYDGPDSEAYKYLVDGIYRGVTAEMAPGVEVLANLVVRTVDETRYSFAQVWR